MIVKGIWYEDQVRSHRARRRLIEAAAVLVGKLPKTSKLDIGFAITMPSRSNGGSISYPIQTPLANEPVASPYWSQRIYDAGRDTFDLEYLYRSNFPITSTATHGGMWSAAAAGFIFNKYFKKNLTKTIGSQVIKNPVASGLLAYGLVTGIASHDASVAATRTSEKRQFWLGGVDMGTGAWN
jgi:hypothetical protein